MTPLELQNELMQELQRILDGYTYKTPEGKHTPINVFEQNIPLNETDDEDDPVPYIIVRLIGGEDSGTRERFNMVNVVVIIGLWDDAPDVQGHKDVMNIIQKVYQRFNSNPDLNGKAAYAGEFKWAIQEDDYYPYWLGACYMQFYIAAIRREDNFA